MPKNASSLIKKYWPLLGILGLITTLFGWGLSTPVGGTPDEDFHLVSIWCANGGQEGMCEAADSASEGVVNSSLVNAACFAHQPQVSAACQDEYSIFESSTLVTTDRGNFGGSYPGLFYTVMHPFASPDIQTSVVMMRFLNALLFCAIIVALWVFLPRALRPSLFYTVTLTVVPLGLFLIPSINPSSWAITGVLSTFFGTVGALQSQGKSRIVLAAISIAGLIMAAGSRYDGFFYALIAVVAATILGKQFKIPRKVFWLSITIIGAATLIAAIFAGAIIFEKLVTFAGGSIQHPEAGALQILARNISDFPWFLAGFSGAMGLGWLDTLMPAITWMIAGTLLWGSLLLRIGEMTRGNFWVSFTLAALLVLIPLVVLQARLATVGENVQSRYLYPLLLVLVGATFFREKDNKAFFSTGQKAVITLGLFTSQTFAIYTNMSRYISGADVEGFSWNLNIAAQDGWWWPAAPTPMLVLALSIVGFDIFLATAFLFERSRTPRDKLIYAQGAAKL